MQVPEGWETKSLSEVASIKHGFAFESDYFFNEEKDHILLTPGNFHVEQKLYFGTNTKFYDGPIPEEYILRNGDLLVVMTDLTKNMAILGNAVLLSSDKKVLHNQRIGLISVDKNIISKKYLCCLLNSNLVRNEVKATASGTTVRHTSPSKILSVSVALPKVEEQQKIAQILSTWDKAITITEQLLANSQQQKKALMQQLLTGKKRLLDDNGQRFSGEWRFFNFGETFKVANKKAAQVKTSEILEQGSIPVIDQGQKFIAGYSNQKETYTDLPVMIFGDHTRCVKWVDFEFCPGADGTQVLKASFNDKFCYYLLLNTDVPNLGYSRHMRELREKDFKLPLDEKEQQKIATVLTAADNEITQLQQKLDRLKQEKKALMQQLLTGKRRVKVEEVA